MADHRRYTRMAERTWRSLLLQLSGTAAANRRQIHSFQIQLVGHGVDYTHYDGNGQYNGFFPCCDQIPFSECARKSLYVCYLTF